MFVTSYVVNSATGEPPPTDRVILLAKMARGLVVDVDLLGTEWVISDAPEPCRLVLPRSPGQDPTTQFSRPLHAPPIPAADEMFAWWTGDDPEARWGETSIDGPDGPETAFVNYALIASDYNPPDERNYRQSFTIAVADHVEAWMNRHAEWLEILSFIDLQPDPLEGPQVGLTQLHNVALSTSATGDRIGHFGYARSPVFRGTSSRSVSVEHWRNACRMADEGAIPPHEHLLLRRARTAWFRDDHRRTVIDACAAVEVALSASLRKHHPLATTQQPEVEKTIQQANGVAQLFDLHQAVRPSATVRRSAIADRLAGPRNQAAHDGAPIEQERARKALDLATEVLEEVSPLPVRWGRHDQPDRGRIDIQAGIVPDHDEPTGTSS